MKHRSAKLAVRVIVFTILIAVLSNGLNAAGIIKFSDVPEEYWGYQTIMKMTETGIFNGVSEPINGVGTFLPEKTMTRAEFITASMRAIYPEEAKTVQNDKTIWWFGYYTLALQKEIVSPIELDGGDLDKAMTREEMAMVMVRCVEKNGETLTQKVKTTQIADYAKIGDYYKEYVRDCFSYGLLSGMDSKGTFAPEKSLTRAEAATVLCRLTDKDARLDVVFEENTKKDDKEKWENFYNSGSNDSYTPQSPGSDKTEPLPWENGGKHPSKYTWEEFEELPDSQKNAFIESFGSSEAFDNWMNEAKGLPDTKDEEKLPWENGGKQPGEYTWEEYEDLPDSQKNAFADSFDSTEAFEEWMNEAKGTPDTKDEEKLPWENGGKQVSEYTWKEYEALPDSQKNAFFDSFGSAEAFEEWMNEAKGIPNTKDNEKLPWENGGKQVSEYTWKEYEALPDSQKNAFFDSFESQDALLYWLNANQP